MKIRVEQKHIDKGCPNSTHDCPVALAMKDAGLPNATVRSGWVSWLPEGSSVYKSARTPKKVVLFMRNFDAHPQDDEVDENFLFEPFEFELEEMPHEVRYVR